jgi:hypothetical protein
MPSTDGQLFVQCGLSIYFLGGTLVSRVSGPIHPDTTRRREPEWAPVVLISLSEVTWGQSHLNLHDHL